MLPSLAGVKGPSGCAVRQNSKSDPVQGPVVLELEERPLLHDVGAPVSEKVEPSSSGDNNDSSNGDPESSSDDDGCSSEAEQDRLSTSKQSRWPDLDEQLLLAYKKEGKSWD